MRTARLRGDLSLIKQGVEVAVGFGVRTLEGLAELGELLEHSVYEPRSLARTPDGCRFILLNPPLRMGAFSSVRIFLDGAPVDPSRVGIDGPDGIARSIDSVTAASPITLPIGLRSRFAVRATTVPAGRHRLRIELQSVAIPPLVWFEFEDALDEHPTAGP
ncbi:MAG: hypothetical protein L3J91_02570 [Thermoplasmata archaeon]|nr:hypothetical protein [Thermoplasmata archaeon]